MTSISIEPESDVRESATLPRDGSIGAFRVVDRDGTRIGVVGAACSPAESGGVD